MGIRDAFRKANQTIADAKKDVERPTDQVAAKRDEKAKKKEKK